MACTQQSQEKEAILEVMSQQEQDWNNGDIDAFMQGYWQSDSLMFVGKNGIKYGWQTTLENYKNSDPTQWYPQVHPTCCYLGTSNQL